MSKRKLKKNLNSGLQQALDNAHDVAVMKEVLFHLLYKIRGESKYIREDPFKDEDLNFWLSVLYSALEDILKK